MAVADGAWPEDAVEVGRIMGAWGVKGGIRIKPFAADPQALFSTKRWYVRPAETPGPRVGSAPMQLKVITAKEHGDGIVATLQDVADRDAAEALKGARVFVSRGSFPTPGADEFYWVDLIGMAVVNRESALLGSVLGLLETGPHCVLRVQPDTAAAAAADGAELLIPFVDRYVDRVVQAERRIEVDWQPDF